MCGIIGYKGVRNGYSAVVAGLKRLEYRGYDSWGIAALDNNIFEKHVGRISTFNPNKSATANICIGHTRWATHGAVTEANAHPHTSYNENIAVVHNGIIENYQELRKELQKQGVSFQSDTDTEVLPHLIDLECRKGCSLKEAMRAALEKVEGSYAIVVQQKGSNILGFARRGSPLMIGIGEHEYFVASDIPAFLESTNKVIFLEDNEYGIINDHIQINRLNNNESIVREPTIVNWTVEEAQKGAFDHYMLKEIHEQKDAILRAIQQDSEVINKAVSMIQNGVGVFFVGCGTSYHACLTASYQFSRLCNKHVNVVLASEFENYKHFVNDKTLIVALSQSGETADLLDAVNVAKKKGAKIMSIVNVVGSSLTRLSDHTVMMNAGPEISVASTKSYTSQLAILLLLAFGVNGQLAKGVELVKLAASHVENVINSNNDIIKDIAKELSSEEHCFLIGRDVAYALALEGALKIKEISYIHAEGFAGGELKHGCIALIEKGTPAIAVSTEETDRLIVSNATEIKSRGGKLIGIGSRYNAIYDHFIKVPNVYEASPLLLVIPVQLLAYHLAVARGNDVDKPRNLAKVVTVL